MHMNTLKRNRICGFLTVMFLGVATVLGGCGKEAAQENEAQAEAISKAVERYEFNLAANDTYTGEQTDEELGDYELIFRGFFSSRLSELTVGKGEGSEFGAYVHITRDLITVGSYGEESYTNEYDCSMNYNNYISVIVKADMQGQARIEISTNGDHLVLENVQWEARQGSAFAKAHDDELTDCTLEYLANGWDKDIWLFGDSYFNAVSETKWTYYLLDNGYENYMLNGFPGRNSQQALEAVKNCLQYGTPKELIWCLGMNDGDQDSVNENWKNCVTELQKLCEENGIELILATIPSCPNVNNDYKNAYIKENGSRYIDFAKAVGAYDSREWYYGMLEENDNPIHPKQKGAIALYNAAVLECPELIR